MKKKILLYTDVGFFAGCEIVLGNIVSFDKITDDFDVVYAYRRSRRYTDDLNNRSFSVGFDPVFVFSTEFAYLWINHRFRSRLLRRILKMPFWLLDKLHILSLMNFVTLFGLVRRHAPDIVHVNNGGYPGADSCRVMALAAKAAGARRVVFTVNNMAYPPSDPLDRWFDGMVKQRVDCFTTASWAAAKQLALVRGMDSETINVVPNAVPFDGQKAHVRPTLRDEFAIAKNMRVIGSSGLLIERKGYHVLVEAAGLLDQASDWCIYVFGEGEERSALEARIRELGLEDKVFLPGFRGNVLDYVADFDVFVLPSTHNEDLPNAINEAMLLGKPIIGTNVAGIPEQIDDGVNGFLVGPEDAAELAQAMGRMIQMSDIDVREMGMASKGKYLDEFSYFKSMHKYYELYKGLE